MKKVALKRLTSSVSVKFKKRKKVKGEDRDIGSSHLMNGVISFFPI